METLAADAQIHRCSLMSEDIDDFRAGYKAGFADGFREGMRALATLPTTQIQTLPVLIANHCPTCGIDWSKPTGYVCGRADCPTNGLSR